MMKNRGICNTEFKMYIRKKFGFSITDSEIERIRKIELKENKMKKLHVLELFSGTRSISKEFEKKGHECITVDNNEYFKDSTTYIMDILSFDVDLYVLEHGYPDIIWASPPCTTFSVASVRHHWIKTNLGEFIPKSEKAEIGGEILMKTLNIISELNPTYFFIENPRGMLRKMPFMLQFEDDFNAIRYTVTYCQYGDDRMKPTDIWTNYPDPKFKNPCKNGDTCHTPAPRGSQTGTQGLKNNMLRSIIPSDLCKHIVNICEEGLHV